jgi:anti-sigma B factor antagonist
MKYTLRQNGNVTIIDVYGRISLDEANSEQEPPLRVVVRELVKNGSRKLVLNLGGVTYVDSSGIGEFISCFATVRKHGGALKITNPPDQVKELLRLTRVDTIINVTRDEAAAINSYRKVVKTTIPSPSYLEP